MAFHWTPNTSDFWLNSFPPQRVQVGTTNFCILVFDANNAQPHTRTSHKTRLIQNLYQEGIEKAYFDYPFIHFGTNLTKYKQTDKVHPKDG